MLAVIYASITTYASIVMKHDNYSNFLFRFSVIIEKKNQQQETRICLSCFDFTAHWLPYLPGNIWQTIWHSQREEKPRI